METSSKEFREMKGHAAQLKFLSGVLVRESQSADQIVLPHLRRVSLLKALHSDPIGWQLGRDQLMPKLIERYYCYSLLTDSDNFCNQGVDCLQRKSACARLLRRIRFLLSERSIWPRWTSVLHM